MLFNSHIFIFLFLPATVLAFYGVGTRLGHRAALGTLLAASLFFYGWWNPPYLLLLVGSIIFNYYMGKLIAKPPQRFAQHRRWLLLMGISTNLGMLGYYKYAYFIAENLRLITPFPFELNPVILPLAISFFTFQQIAFLVDAYQTQSIVSGFGAYALFVTFFPQLIAGPIVHHHELLPQLRQKGLVNLNSENIAVGLTIFSLGLFKKVIIADGIATYAAPVFGAAAQAIPITFFEAWGGVLAYTFQIYFDFSGYSDMAIGLARLFGIILPLNFNAPYQADNIIDFWRRWHITLSRFLRDYLYIPLGGSRRGQWRRYINLAITMLLGGIWHGAGWTFIIWGALHGFYLIVNHLWRDLIKARKPHAFAGSGWRWFSRALTFFFVVIAWVFFRADSLATAKVLLQGMAGMNGFTLPITYLQHLNQLHSLGDWLVLHGWRFETELLFDGLIQIQYLALLFVISWFVPEVHHLMTDYRPVLTEATEKLQPQVAYIFQWHPTKAWAIGLLTLTMITILNLNKISEFLYFQF